MMLPTGLFSSSDLEQFWEYTLWIFGEYQMWIMIIAALMIAYGVVRIISRILVPEDYDDDYDDYETADIEYDERYR